MHPVFDALTELAALEMQSREALPFGYTSQTNALDHGSMVLFEISPRLELGFITEQTPPSQ